MKIVRRPVSLPGWYNEKMSKNILPLLMQSTRKGIVKWSVEPDGSLRSAMGRQSIKLIYGKSDGIVTAEISDGITAAMRKEKTPTKFSSREAGDVSLLFCAALKSIGKNSN